MTAFLDSNVLIYWIIDKDPRKAVAQRILEEGGLISVQVLNEFANVAHRKLRLAWAHVAEALSALRTVLPPPLPLTVELQETAVALAGRYDFAFYDALIIAAALEAECDTVLTEDMQHGMVVNGRLKIVNPFRST